MSEIKITNVLRIASGCIIAVLLAISIAAGINKAAALQRGPQADVKLLTHGTTREAPQFAGGVTEESKVLAIWQETK